MISIESELPIVLLDTLIMVSLVEEELTLKLQTLGLGHMKLQTVQMDTTMMEQVVCSSLLEEELDIVALLKPVLLVPQGGGSGPLVRVDRAGGLRVGLHTGPMVAGIQSAFAENWVYCTSEVLVGPRFFPPTKPGPGPCGLCSGGRCTGCMPIACGGA